MPKNAENPHPEHRAGAADKDCAGDAGDITGADGDGQSRGDGLKSRQVFAVLGLFLLAAAEQSADCVSHNVAKLCSLDTACPNGQINAGSHQQEQHDRPPNDIVQIAIDGRDQFIHKNAPQSQFPHGTWASTAKKRAEHRALHVRQTKQHHEHAWNRTLPSVGEAAEAFRLLEFLRAMGSVGNTIS